MSNSIAKPWLRTTALELVGDNKPRNSKSLTALRSRTVQVVRVNEEMTFLVVNDKENTVPVMLTKACVERLGGLQKLGDLRNSVVTLTSYFFSSTIQSGGGRDTNRLLQLGVSLPLALQCDMLEVDGAEGCDIMGEPCDLNKDARVQPIISRLQFITMTQRLATRQFPDHNVLPNSGPWRPPFGD